MEREALIDLLLELQQSNGDLYLEIAEGLSILGYDDEPEEVEGDDYDDAD
jgi:hypothetical protein